jgi:cyclohexanone monooxygenase
VVDKVELAKKYAEERAKRVRPEGLKQYVRLSLDSDFENDPFVDKPVERNPVRRETQVAVVGGGWSGLLTTVNLRKAGVDDFLIIERGADFGGTWYWNRYPGIACDCDAYLYMPLLEETGYVPSRRYAPGDEIMEYSHLVAKKFNLYKNSLLQTTVTKVVWDDDTNRWTIHTNHGDEISARFLVIGTGILHRPKLPGIPGIDDFKGVSFHSSRWDFDYTGGNARGGLDKLKDKRVALIGTGPTGLQVMPHLARSSSELYVFQRTPIVVAPRNDQPTHQEWFKRQEPGWQRRRMDNFEALLSGKPVEERLVDDAWIELWHVPPPPMTSNGGPPDLHAYAEQLEDLDISAMEAVRKRVEEIVEDSEVAASLKPWYGVRCKRPTFHDEYLQSFNLPNVHLVDTDGRGPDCINERGVVFDGTEYEVDLIVYATGFESVVTVDRSGGFDIVGVDGITMSEAFKKRVRTVHGIHAHEFPNMFIIGGVRGSGGGVNVLYGNTIQANFLGENLRQLLEAGVVRHQVKAETVQQWCDDCDAISAFNPEALAKCTPGYFNNEGVFDVEGDVGRPLFADVYYGGGLQFEQILRKWNESREYFDKCIIDTGKPAEPS